jgi:DNA primase
LVSVTFSAGARAQGLAPSSLGGDSRSDEVTNDVVQVITAKTEPSISKKTRKLLKESVRISAEKPVRVSAKKPTEAAAKKPTQAVEAAPSRAAFTMEPVRPMNQPTVNQTVQHGSRFSFRSLQGKKESVPVITDYYPKRIVYPYAKIDRRIDNRLVQAATVAQERAHAHSRSRCWHYVKDALLASGVIDSRPKTELARDAASELVTNYGFKKLSITDPFSAPVGSVLVYGTARSVGHVEIRTKDGFVSDFRSQTPSKRPLMGVYAKL